MLPAGVWWAVRDAAQHLTMCGTEPTTKINDLAPNADHAKGDNGIFALNFFFKPKTEKREKTIAPLKYLLKK